MKKLIVLLLVLCTVLLFLIVPVLAVETTGSATPGLRDQQITELKQRLATKVAQLKILSPQVIVGTIKTLSDQKIILNWQGKDADVEISSDTNLSQVDQNNNSKALKIANLQTGQTLIAWGNFNKDTNTLTADNIVLRDLPQIFIGQIKSVDKKNYQFLMTSDNKDIPYLFDVNPPTRTYTLDNNGKLVKSGFSQLEKDQTVFVYGFMGDKTKTGEVLLSAKRIIVLNQPEATPTPSSTPTPTPKKK